MPSLRKRLVAVATALVASAIPALLAAQIAPAEYAARRDSLLAHVDSGVVVAFGAVEPVTHWPSFEQLPSFDYLTGFHEPDAVLLLVKRGGARSARLFLKPRNRGMERYVGARTGPDESQARTGIPGRALAELGAAVDSLAAAGLPLYVVSDVHTGDYAEVDSLTRGSSFVRSLRGGRPGLVVMKGADDVVGHLRARKSPAEAALLRRAAEISAAGHRDAMRAMAPGCNEGEIQAVLEGAFRRLGGERPGYGSIVGSGPNALALHYDRNDRTMLAGELVVIDAATSVGHYSADVTRTLPVTGRFTPDQRAVYQLVLDAQAAYVRQIRPGGAEQVASDSGQAVVAAGLARLGLLESPGATFDGPGRCGQECPQVYLFAWHGFGGHGIGLEVHDPVQFYDAPNQFRPGDVFTVEPGIYVDPSILNGLPDTPRNRAMTARMRPAMQRYLNVGVRIEDNYLVTGTGVELLSKDVPREAAAVEALMAEPSPPLPGGGQCGAAGGR
jgi:Xaa-Pro aminopeptidase